MSISEAADRVDQEGRPWRIARRDEEVFALTDDLVPGRVTFEVDAGLVTSSFVETRRI